jgi:hypothetical protein
MVWNRDGVFLIILDFLELYVASFLTNDGITELEKEFLELLATHDRKFRQLRAPLAQRS